VKKLYVFLVLAVFATALYVSADEPTRIGFQKGDIKAINGYFDNLYVGGGSVVSAPLQLLNVPGAALPDTVSAATDSASVMALADTANYSEYPIYLHVFGNGTDPQDRAIFVLPVMPTSTAFDSLIVWLRSDETSADSTKLRVALRLKDAGGVTTIKDTTLTAASEDTWERYALVITGVTLVPHTFIAEAAVGRDHHMDVGAAYLK